MIAAARSCFSAYRFDGGTALFACGVSSSPDEVGRRPFHLASCVVVPGACSRPHHLIISSSRAEGGSSVLTVFGRRLVLPWGSLFSSDATIVRRALPFILFQLSYELRKTA